MNKSTGCILLFSMLVAISVGSSSCECGENLYHYFPIPFSVSPPADSVQVGDTIWISATASEMMMDSVTRQARNIIGAKISFSMSMYSLTGPNDLTAGVPYFDFAVVDGARVDVGKDDADRLVSVDFVENNNSYRIKVGVVCNTIGQYSFNVENNPYTSLPGYGGCEYAFFTFPILNRDNHLYILQNTAYLGDQINEDFARTTYSFKVY